MEINELGGSINMRESAPVIINTYSELINLISYQIIARKQKHKSNFHDALTVAGILIALLLIPL